MKKMKVFRSTKRFNGEDGSLANIDREPLRDSSGNIVRDSSGEAIKAVEEVASQTLPHGYGIDWAGLSYDETRRGNEAIYIFLVVLVFVYFVLAGQYESFIIPLAVILSLPAGIFGSFLLIKGLGLANDIYAQVGLVMLVGLLGKNAVLIVEFAVQKQQEGMSVLEAAIEGLS